MHPAKGWQGVELEGVESSLSWILKSDWGLDHDRSVPQRFALNTEIQVPCKKGVGDAVDS